MTLQELLANRPVLHMSGEGRPMEMGVPDEMLEMLDTHATPDSTTLETGCGLSTIFFAAKGTRHLTITPARREFEEVERFCRERGVSTSKISFHEGPSERVLPTLETPPLDIVLIDGRHGFPAPMIDWFYTAGNLKVGGLMVIDDIWLWSCLVLKDVMSEQPEWEHVTDIGQRTSIFRKLKEGSEWLEWTAQPYVVRSGYVHRVGDQYMFLPPALPVDTSTPLTRALQHIRRGEVGTLTKKVARRLRMTGG